MCHSLSKMKIQCDGTPHLGNIQCKHRACVLVKENGAGQLWVQVMSAKAHTALSIIHKTLSNSNNRGQELQVTRSPDWPGLF